MGHQEELNSPVKIVTAGRNNACSVAAGASQVLLSDKTGRQHSATLRVPNILDQGDISFPLVQRARKGCHQSTIIGPQPPLLAKGEVISLWSDGTPFFIDLVITARLPSRHQTNGTNISTVYAAAVNQSTGR